MSSNDDGKPKENGAQDESKPINAAIEGPHPTIIKVPQKVLILLSTVNFSQLYTIIYFCSYIILFYYNLVNKSFEIWDWKVRGEKG